LVSICNGELTCIPAFVLILTFSFRSMKMKMVGLRALTEVLLGYGERHFDGPPNLPGSRRSVWAGVCLCAGSSNRSASFFYFCLPFELNDVGTGCCCFVGIPRNRG
jgi:hypothetical protein